MAYPLLQLLDDDGAVVFDFQDDTGAANPSTLKCYISDEGFNLAVPTGQALLTESASTPGGSRSRKRDELVTSSFNLVVSATTAENLVQGVETLRAMLDRFSQLKWQMDASSNVRYVDLVDGSVGALFRGQEALGPQILGSFTDVLGLPVTIVRQPTMRFTRRLGTDYKLKNATLLADQNGNGTPDFWAWDSSTNITNQAVVDEYAQFDIATTSTRNFQQTSAAGSYAPGDTPTFRFRIKVSGGTNVKVEAVIRFKDSGGTNLGSETVSTQVTPTTTEQVVSVTASAAPASTSMAQVSIRFRNSSATSRTVYMRHAQIGPDDDFMTGAEIVSNDPAVSSSTGMGRVVPVWNDSDCPTPFEMYVVPQDAAAKVTNIRVAVLGSKGITGGKELTDYLNTRKVLQCESATMKNSTASTADANASGGNMAQTSGTGMLRRLRHDVSTLLDSLRGPWDVWVRLRATAQDNYKVQLKYSPSSADPAIHSLPEVSFTTLDTGSTFKYVDIPLGQINVPESGDLSGVAVELWANCPSGALCFDFLCFIPSGDLSEFLPLYQTEIIAAPSSAYKTLGKDMTGTNTDDGNSTIIDALADSAIGPSLSGLPVGRHRMTFHYSNTELGGSDVLYMKIRNTTDSTDTAIRTHSSGFDAAQDRKEVIEWDAVAGKTYRPEMGFTGWTEGVVTVHDYVYEFVPAITQNEIAHCDPEKLIMEKQNSSGQHLFDLTPSGGVPLWLGPGLNLVYLHFGDVRWTNTGASSVPYDQPESILTRNPSVYFAYYPRKRY